MTTLPNGYFERPISFDVDANGRFVVLDQGGERLSLVPPGGEPSTIRGSFHAVRCRFLGDAVVVLGADGLVRTIRGDGSPVGEARVRAGAMNLAIARSGALLVAYGRRGVQDHGVVVERLAPSPASFRDAAVFEAGALAVESGGFWIAGTGAPPPAARALRLRPAGAALVVRASVALPAPPRTAAVGYDNALYVVLEPGESVVRVDGERADAARPLPEPAVEIGRAGKRLLSCGPRGFRDISELVPKPPG